MPKSQILRSPVLLKRMLWGLRSRCMTQLSWRYSMPRSSCTMSCLISESWNGCGISSISVFKS